MEMKFIDEEGTCRTGTVILKEENFRIEISNLNNSVEVSSFNPPKEHPVDFPFHPVKHTLTPPVLATLSALVRVITTVQRRLRILRSTNEEPAL